jgi:hypothetical protein
MKPTFHYLYLDEGTDFESQELYWTDKDGNAVDLSTYILTAKMKKHADSVEAISPAISLTVSVTDAPMGEYQLTLPSTQAVDHVTYVFEVIATKGGKKTKIAEGQVIIRPGV